MSIGCVWGTALCLMLANFNMLSPTKKPKASEPKKAVKQEEKKASALDFKMKDIDGKDQDLKQYDGKVVLMVNTASQCGFTPQYKGLEKLYAKYKDKGLVILGFPANDFGQQEPGSNKDIKTFCTQKYNVTFPMFAKVRVKGKKMCDLYKYLTSSDSGHKFGGPIKWNFNKFLISRQGAIIGRYDSPVTPESDKLTKAIEEALAQSAGAPSDKPSAKNGD